MLQAMIPQLTSEIEVVVRDDSTNLETQAVFDDLFPKDKLQHAYHKGERIGVDRASIFLVEQAQGKFIWFFSDDDLFLPGVVSNILPILKEKKNLTSVWVNYKVGSKSHVSGLSEPLFCKDAGQFLDIVGSGIGLISTQLFRRDLGLQGIPIARQFIYGFSFASTAVYLNAVTAEGESCIMPVPQFECYPTTNEEFRSLFIKNGTINNPAFKVYGVEFYKIVRAYENKIPNGAARRLLAKNYGYVWRGMLVAWVGGWDTPSGKRWQMFKLYWSFPEFWIAIVAFSIPLWLNKSLYKIYKIFFFERKFIFHKKS